MTSCFSVDVNIQDNFRWTALHHACHANQPDIAQLLVDSHADIDSQALNGGNYLLNFSHLMVEKGG